MKKKRKSSSAGECYMCGKRFSPKKSYTSLSILEDPNGKRVAFIHHFCSEKCQKHYGELERSGFPMNRTLARESLKLFKLLLKRKEIKIHKKLTKLFHQIEQLPRKTLEECIDFVLQPENEEIRSLLLSIPERLETKKRLETEKRLKTRYIS